MFALVSILRAGTVIYAIHAVATVASTYHIRRGIRLSQLNGIPQLASRDIVVDWRYRSGTGADTKAWLPLT